ncbi:hypothetical protein EYR38_006647 [Pleurotus pulmonarius]|nr:hypothetical protein EYR38_006647 [Pleurotus pulmonarius]
MPTITAPFQDISPTRVLLPVTSSEAASLKGHKAKTPILAGSICGGVMGLAWIIGFTYYFIKRARRKKRKAAIRAGLIPPPEPKVSEEPEEKIIIPPDPAVLLGQRQPGEHVYVNGKLVPSRPSMGSRPVSIDARPSVDARPSMGSRPVSIGSHPPSQTLALPGSSMPPAARPNSSDTPPATPITPLTARISEEMIIPRHV